jgi:hypothetical protein
VLAAGLPGAGGQRERPQHGQVEPLGHGQLHPAGGERRLVGEEQQQRAGHQ